MPDPSIDTLVRVLQKHRLLDDDQFQQLAELAQAASDARSLGETLVQRSWLTDYQWKEVSQGRAAGLLIGSYLLLDKLGEGGMGQVFKARQRGLSRVVALKRIQPKLLENPDAARRFKREAAAASALDHPNIVRQEHTELDAAAPWLTMEFLEGTDLARLVRESGPLPITEACDCARQAALGLQHAHERGLVHRDIKPHNLMRTPRGVVKVLDLGLALPASATTLTASGGFLGTGDYIAPEQVLTPHKVDIRADVYSLGCTLYHLLAGCPPFEETHAGARAALHCSPIEPMTLEERRPEVPIELCEVVRKMMAKQREGRYRTPGEAAEALAPFCVEAPKVVLRPRPIILQPPAPVFAKELTNSIGMKLALIPAGRFLMGSPDSEANRLDREGPLHEVEITRPFYLGVYPVTQEEYERVMGENPSCFCAKGSGKDNVKGLDTRRFPVENVTWDDAVEFCRKLSEMAAEKKKERLYRLPTEAEWEYSCRGGATLETSIRTPFCFGTSASSTQANFDGNYPYGGAPNGPYLERTTPVGHYKDKVKPHPFGLFDMHGNVWEWCADWFDENYYAHSPKQNPQGPDSGNNRRVLRGGSWLGYGHYCRAALRNYYDPGNRFNNFGFRVVCVLGARTS